MFVYGVHHLVPGDHFECPCLGHAKIISTHWPDDLEVQLPCCPGETTVLPIITSQAGRELLFPCAGRCRSAPKSPD